METPKSTGTVVLSIIMLVIGGATGATVDRLLGVHEQIKREMRDQKVSAYTDWITFTRAAEGTGLPEAHIKEQQARTRVMIFGGKDVLESKAAFSRADARRKFTPDEIAKHLNKESETAKSFAETNGRYLLALRREFQGTDDVSWQTLVTIECPNPGLCRGEYFASHLFDRSFYGQPLEQ